MQRGETPLIVAVKRGNEDEGKPSLDIIKLLQQFKADLNNEDYYGQRPLDYAEKLDKKTIFEYLKSEQAEKGSGQINKDFVKETDEAFES